MGKIAFLFAGQGAQYPGMGKDLYYADAAARRVFDASEKIRKGTLEVCFNGTPERLALTENTQPCLFLTDLACAEALRARGIEADMAAGFSLGELPALCFAGAMKIEDAFGAVVVRGNAMAQCASKKKGGMAAVLKLSKEEVERICASFSEVYPVNYNCPGQIACAGAEEQMDDFIRAVKEAGGRAVKLNVSGAFHTPFMENAEKELFKALSETEIFPPRIPVYSDMTACVYPDEAEKIRTTLAAQLKNSVRWEEIVRKMAASGADTFVEVGAGKTLSGLVAKTLEGVKILNVGDAAGLENAVSQIKGDK